ncbi:hypothetical protein LINGRAHAP2_LOCUS12380 [Linum grandiflorum]
MFDSLTKTRFYTKCRSLTKTTKTRLDSSTKKKKAVAKYLRRDIAELLRNGLDSNAYGRADGLIVEQNLAAAYEFMDGFCDCIFTNLVTLDKQMECPKECREAIQSLMYAAARLAEFPELRDLRSVFVQRYGDCLELFLNKEFAELLNPKPATKETKIQLLVDVAEEFSIKWDPKSFAQKPPKPNIPQVPRRRSEAEAAPIYIRAKSESITTRRNSISAAPVASENDEQKKPSKPMPPPPYVRAKPDGPPKPPRSVRPRQPRPDEEEERKLDELLMMHSRRTNGFERSVTHTTGTNPVSWRPSNGVEAPEEHRRRARSLSEVPEEHRRHARSLSDVPSRHVHPNLPDYDSLADRIAALKAKNW